MQDGFASMVWSTTPALASKIRTLPKNDFINLVNAAFRLRVADLEYFFSQFGNDNFDIGFEFDWRNNVEAKKTSLPPLVLNVQEKSRAGFPLRMRNAESYVDERVVLVGDAAHTIHPLAGQGLNQGLADVQCLAKVIEYGITTGQDLGNLQLLRNYSSERYLSNILMLGAVDKLHKLFGTKITPLVCIRSLGLEMINRIGPLKSEIMKYAMGI
ncbi:hypothetical protein Glove_382g32 [Diversispora epigaea]|uniref:FAD-binding domain-containing protein n=1 Tax=Diversispora epigaea TaxID=1348612 RepID=A0A397H466_9GLOM|nr:hypothetical protein Glove_382g32 [Diversispora epigaea]